MIYVYDIKDGECLGYLYPAMWWEYAAHLGMKPGRWYGIVWHNGRASGLSIDEALKSFAQQVSRPVHRLKIAYLNP